MKLQKVYGLMDRINLSKVVGHRKDNFLSFLTRRSRYKFVTLRAPRKIYFFVNIYSASLSAVVVGACSECNILR